MHEAQYPGTSRKRPRAGAGEQKPWCAEALERFQFSLKQGYRQCPESAEGVAGYWRDPT